MTVKLKQFMYDNKILLFILPFIISWCIWITNGIKGSESRDIVMGVTIAAQDKLNSQAYNKICEDISEIKTAIDNHQKENKVEQKEMQRLIFDLVKELKSGGKMK